MSINLISGFLIMGMLSFSLRLNLLQINHQIQILINVNGPVVTVKVPVVAPFHNTPARSRCNIQLHAVLIVGCLYASRYGTSLFRLANRPDVIGRIIYKDSLDIPRCVPVYIGPIPLCFHWTPRLLISSLMIRKRS